MISIAEFKKTLEKCLAVRGLKYIKKNYYLNSEKLIIVINVQKSDYEDGYYINYGFYVKDIHEDASDHPKIPGCDIMGRFSYETGGRQEFIFSLDSFSTGEFEEVVLLNIERIIVPVIEKGIEEYFKMFPNAVCAAKLKLREYLALAKK